MVSLSVTTNTFLIFDNKALLLTCSIISNFLILAIFFGKRSEFNDLDKIPVSSYCGRTPNRY